MVQRASAKVTIRQELFLRELMKLENQTKAWQKIYKVKKRRCAQAASSNTLRKPHVRKRFNELLERQMKKSDITVDKVLSDLQWSIDRGKADGKPSDVIAGANAQAKLVGLLRERVETGMVGDFGDTNSIADVLELVAKEAGPEAAMTLAAMFGLKVPDSNTSRKMEEAALFIADPPSDAVN
jgi:hypothetical protein